MKTILKYLLLPLVTLALLPIDCHACTSMLVSAKASATGRPLMWKHRDSDAESSFIERVDAKGGRIGYVALFNAGDSLHREAWMGMNDAGFAIMNTASYNVQPDTARIKDREGIFMSVALQSCRSVNDFENMLKTLKRPLGVQANFGVMDANGGLCYFEVNDNSYVRFNVNDSPDGYLIRTNFSISGQKGQGKGYARYSDLLEIIKPEISAHAISPESLTEKASRSFYNSIMKKDFAADSCKWVMDQDFIPRSISSSSIVIEGVNPDQPVSDMIMWAMLGYPPCSFVMPVRLQSIPKDLLPTEAGYSSPFCNKIVALKRQLYGITADNGVKYLNMEMLKPFMDKAKQNSLSIYQSVRGTKTDAQSK